MLQACDHHSSWRQSCYHFSLMTMDSSTVTELLPCRCLSNGDKSIQPCVLVTGVAADFERIHLNASLFQQQHP